MVGGIQVIDTLAIVGVGLIGGSIAKGTRARALARHIVGLDSNPEVSRWALDNGLIDQVVDTVPDTANVVALCVPSDQIADWASRLADHSATVFDVGSVKGEIVDSLRRLDQVPENFVPTHPISGSEKSGPAAADSDLFQGCTVVCTPLSHSAQRAAGDNVSARSLSALATCEEFWAGLGAKTVRMDAEQHDQALAVTSHLPHLLAFAYMHQVTPDQLPLTGGGFRDFSRIAAAHPELWWNIFRLNEQALLDSLAQFTEQAQALAEAIRANDKETGLKQIAAAAAKRAQADSLG